MPPVEFPALEREGYAGTKLGRFDIMAKLGTGGMSEVFLAMQKSVGGFQRPVVLKRILEAVRRNEDFLRMFVKEAKITSALNHPGIAHLYELVHEDDQVFMVMEFVPGATLVEVARACHLAREPIPIGFTASVARDTALALHYAHTFTDPAGRLRPVIHRDVAEKNIMVALDGSVKLLDFGIARQTDTPNLTQVGTVKGTAGYMSPEQVRGEKLDARTDVFSLGVVLHECLTGQRLFRRNTMAEEVQALLEGPIAPPSQKNREVPPALDAVTLKALSRDKGQRYPTAKEFASAVAEAAGELSWSQQTRSEFVQRHFEVRQADITALLGDPAATDLGELLPDSRERVTRDEFKAVGSRPFRQLAEERTQEVRSATAAARQLAAERRAAPLEPDEPDEDGLTIRAPPEPRTVPESSLGAAKAAARRGDSQPRSVSKPRPIDSIAASTYTTALLDEDHTVVEGDDSHARITEEANSKRELSPARLRQKNLAAQKQALLMWIAVGSGMVLGLVLAAFLIFG